MSNDSFSLSNDLLLLILKRSYNGKLLICCKAFANELPWYKRRWIAANKIKRMLWRATFAYMYPINATRIALSKTPIERRELTDLCKMPKIELYHPMFTGDGTNSRVEQINYNLKLSESDPATFAWASDLGMLTPKPLQRSRLTKFYADTPIGSNGAHKFCRAKFIGDEIKMRRMIRDTWSIYPIQYVNDATIAKSVQGGTKFSDNFATPCINLNASFIITKLFINTKRDYGPLIEVHMDTNGIRNDKFMFRRIGRDIIDNTYTYVSRDNLAMACEFDTYIWVMFYELNSNNKIKHHGQDPSHHYSLVCHFITVKDKTKDIFDIQLLPHIRCEIKNGHLMWAL